MADENLNNQESELDQYVVEDEQPSWWDEFAAEQVRRAPWWTISFLVHLIALLVLWKWPYQISGFEQASSPVPVNLVDEKENPIVEKPEPPEEKPPDQEELDVPIEDIPISPEPVSKKEPGPDLGLPPVDEMMRDVDRNMPSIDPPSNTPVLAVIDPTKRGITTGIYSGRNSFGTGTKVGGGGGTSRHAESCVMAGLIWLAKAQDKDGHWDCRFWDGGGDYDVGMTGLALLAFLGAGYTHKKGKFQETVGRGLNWLKSNQRQDGSFGFRTFYEEGISTMAVSEAYGLTRDVAVRRMAQAAIDYLCNIQPDHGGFRYGGAVPKEQGDMSVTGWQIMAIKSGICSELNVPPQAVERSRIFLKNAYRQYGGSSYLVGTDQVHGAMTAIGMLCRQFIGGEGFEAEIDAAARWLMEHEKKQGGAGGPGGQGAPQGFGGQHNVLTRDLYYTYYSVLAMFQMGGEYWSQWNKMFREPLVKLQETKRILDEKGRFVRGSWDPANEQWGRQGGRVYSTAMAILCLEVYYRFLPVYKR